jgi:hypothetical protein
MIFHQLLNEFLNFIFFGYFLIRKTSDFWVSDFAGVLGQMCLKGFDGGFFNYYI